ncbi:50S ribosomal protein L17 [Candidatus Roizmanbacteria bacterium]|nr:50S ribosomal protein L17 [Candidatus Roizmanbacteria bacterium]
MRHRVKKIKLSQGKDANKMLLRKLVVNFITHGKIETTLNRVKVLKTEIEKLVEKAKEKKEANKNYLQRILNDQRFTDKIFDQIGQALKDKVGGYVRIVKLGRRDSDGAEFAKMEWVYPVVLDEKKEQIKEKKVLKKNGTPDTINKTG